MIRPLRKTHLRFWIFVALAIPVTVVSAVLVRPHFPHDLLLQPPGSIFLPVVLKSADKDGYTINIRTNTDTSRIQLEWINKKILTYPAATIYEDVENTQDVSRALLIGRIETRGTYRFDLGKDLRSNYHFIVYDFIHQKTIDTITL